MIYSMALQCQCQYYLHMDHDHPRQWSRNQLKMLLARLSFLPQRYESVV